MNDFNWAKKKNSTVTESDINELKKAIKVEKNREKNGWRYIRVKPNTQMLVPCDESGKPTEQGMKMIERIKNA